MSKKVLFLVGSLRENSFNSQLANTAKELIGDKAEVSFLDISQFPSFNQDIEKAGHPVVDEARKQVMANDALWIFSPIYNHDVPGVVKNAIDWLSRALDLSNLKGPSALQDKVTTVSSVGAAGHERMFAVYRNLLPFVRTQLVDQFTAIKPNESAWVDGKLVLDQEGLEALQVQVDAVLDALK